MDMSWPFLLAECWWSWWQRCRRWRWTRRSLAASGPSSSSTPMSRDSKRFQGTHCSSLVSFLVLLLLYFFCFSIFFSCPRPTLFCFTMCSPPGWNNFESGCTPASKNTPGQFKDLVKEYTRSDKISDLRSKNTPGQIRFSQLPQLTSQEAC